MRILLLTLALTGCAYDGQSISHVMWPDTWIDYPNAEQYWSREVKRECVYEV